ERAYALHDLVYTALERRSQHAERLAVVGRSLDELRQGLRDWRAGAATRQVVRGHSEGVGPLALLFTGQGSQYAAMGQELYQTSKVYREAFDRCSDAAREVTGVSLRDRLYGGLGGEDETENTQPLLFALEWALWEVWLHAGLEPAYVLGHSVGEYVAATVSGIFTVEDGVRLVAHRGLAMKRFCERGGMWSIRADEDAVHLALRGYEDVLGIAAVNGPNHVVVSGPHEALRAVEGVFQAAGMKVKPLPVSHAFHSPIDRKSTRLNSSHVKSSY